MSRIALAFLALSFTAVAHDAPDIKSAGTLAFGPQGILFMADPQGAAIYAIKTKVASKSARGTLEVKGLDKKIAGLVGTLPENIVINDVVVRPGVQEAWVSATRVTQSAPPGRRRRGPPAGDPLLAHVTLGGVKVVDLTGVEATRAALPNAPEPREAGEGRRRRRAPSRHESITDMEFVGGKLLVAGLSNEEFASTLRSIPYPFKGVDKGVGIEIYHGAHGALETHAPIRTFTVYEMGGEPHLFAAYTCTPLVRIPMKDLKPGGRVRGQTIAELGNRNRPLDMVSYEKDGKSWMLIANSSRGMMKLNTTDLATEKLVGERVARGESAGVPYETLKDWKGVTQMDRLDEKNVLILVRNEDGSHDLVTRALP